MSRNRNCCCYVVVEDGENAAFTVSNLMIEPGHSSPYCLAANEQTRLDSIYLWFQFVGWAHVLHTTQHSDLDQTAHKKNDTVFMFIYLCISHLTGSSTLAA